jgi:hypothetical protein
MTAAATHEQCLRATGTSCDACGLLFQPIPAEHFTGNIWTSTCLYIRKLHTPERFREKRKQTVGQLNQLRVNRTILVRIMPVAPWTYGTGRYLSEHWLGSHPSVRACDVSITSTASYWKEDGRKSTDFYVQMAPRWPVTVQDDDGWRGKHGRRVLDNRRLRLREWVLLPGKLFRWTKEYNEIPPPDSWMWGWHPDGERWKNATSGVWSDIVDILSQEQQRG